MKKNLFLVLLFACIASTINAQDSSQRNFVLKFSPQHLINNTLHVGAEVFNKSFSHSHNFFLDTRYYENEAAKLNGASAEYQYRIYAIPFGNHPGLGLKKKGGIYLGPFVRYGYYHLTYTDYSYYYGNTGEEGVYKEEDRISALTPGVLLGGQLAFGIVHLDLYLGGGVRLATVERDITLDGNDYTPQYYSYGDIFSPSYRGVVPKMGLNIGVSL